jgi:hypothetical protein
MCTHPHTHNLARQFFWDWRNPAAIEYVIAKSEQGPYGTDSPYVDGTFSDDITGIPAEHSHAPVNMGMSALEVCGSVCLCAARRRCRSFRSRVGSRVLAVLPWTLRHRVPSACARPRQLLEVQNATQVYFQQLITTLAPKGKYVWNALSGYVQVSWGCVLPLPD